MNICSWIEFKLLLYNENFGFVFGWGWHVSVDEGWLKEMCFVGCLGGCGAGEYGSILLLVRVSIKVCLNRKGKLLRNK